MFGDEVVLQLALAFADKAVGIAILAQPQDDGSTVAVARSAGEHDVHVTVVGRIAHVLHHGTDAIPRVHPGYLVAAVVLLLTAQQSSSHVYSAEYGEGEGACEDDALILIAVMRRRKLGE